MDRALVTSPRVGGFGSGRQDPDVTGQVQWRVRNAVPEKTQPTRARRLARASLGGCAQAQSQPIGVQPRPPSSRSPRIP